MSKFDRRHFLTFVGALVPSFFLTKAEAFSGFSLEKAAKSALGAYVTKSSAIKSIKLLKKRARSTSNKLLRDTL